MKKKKNGLLIISEKKLYNLAELYEYTDKKYGVKYKSKQSYYDLLSAGGLSRHKSGKENPKKDEKAVLARREEIKKADWKKKRYIKHK